MIPNGKGNKKKQFFYTKFNSFFQTLLYSFLYFLSNTEFYICRPLKIENQTLVEGGACYHRLGTLGLNCLVMICGPSSQR